MTVGITMGPAAEALLEDRGFLLEWQALYNVCAWGTVMQAPEFVAAWHHAYSPTYELVFVHAREKGRLIGFLPLALQRHTGTLVAAGGHHAEYQTWLAPDRDAADAFIVAAIDELTRRFRGRTLRLLFLAPRTPLSWRTGDLERTTELREFRRPLLHVGDGAGIRETLRKRNNKLKLRKLGQGHPLSLVRLDTAEALGEVFDELIALATFRLSGFYREPVVADPYKRAFYEQLMRGTRLLHATVLMAGGAIVSGQLNLRNRSEMLWGFAAYAPPFAHYSPSYMHLLLLAEQLATAGTVETFDLTPGGEYKDRIATHFDTAHALTIPLGMRARATLAVRRVAARFAKAALARAGVDRTLALDRLDRVRHHLRRTHVASLPGKVARRLRRRLRDTRELRIYSMERPAIRALPRPMLMACNSVEDLLRYVPDEAWQPPERQFHRLAALEMEAGNRVYSFVQEERLLHYGWMSFRQDTCELTDVGQVFHPLPNSAVLWGFYTSPPARGRGLYRAALQQMLHDAMDEPGIERVYVGVLGDNAPSRRVIESLGFRHEVSFHQTVRLGRPRRWRDDASTSSTTRRLARPASEAEST